MKITLSSFELHHAASVGVARNVSALRDGRPLEAGRFDSGFGRHCDGAIAEYAVAKALNICWTPAVGRLDTHTGDVGGYHVKATTRRGGSLIVRSHDPDGFAYVYCELELPDVEIVGWLYGSEAKRRKFWREVGGGIHQAAFFVPRSELRPLEQIQLSRTAA